MTSDPWYPLLALIERDERQDSNESALPPRRALIEREPSARLREAINNLCRALREELPGSAAGQQFWLLLDTGLAAEAASPTAPSLEVSRVLEELRHRFQELRPATDGEGTPDFELFLREKMRSLGFDDLSSAPLLPELQREAMRGLGVGLGSQMAQMLGRMAGWHNEGKAGKPRPEDESRSTGVRLLRLELGPSLAADKASTVSLRQELGKIRRRTSGQLGWEISSFGLAANRDLPDEGWRLLLRAEPIASGEGSDHLLECLEEKLARHSEALFPFADFETMIRQPGCKLVVKELRHVGLEKATLWTICRRVLAAGGNLRDPLTVLERILLASTGSHLVPDLVQAALGEDRSTT